MVLEVSDLTAIVGPDVQKRRFAHKRKLFKRFIDANRKSSHWEMPISEIRDKIQVLTYLGIMRMITFSTACSILLCPSGEDSG